MLMFCSLYVFDSCLDSSTYPFIHSFFRKYTFLYIFDQLTYFRYLVGKSTPFSVIFRIFGDIKSPIFRGYALFLAVSAHSIFIFKMYRDIQSYPNSNGSIFLQNVKSCMYLSALFHFCSPLPFSLVVDTSSIPMIPLISL